MKAAPFAYLSAGSVAEALDLLARHGADARVLAGGQSLMPLLNRRALRPRVLIDIGRLASLRGWSVAGGVLRIGALATYRSLERAPDVARLAPLLAAALPWIGNPAVRNLGTAGGSLAHADPAAELPACAVCLDAVVRLESARGVRELRAEDFFTGRFRTAARADELLTELHWPVAASGEVHRFAEMGRRGRDAAVAGVALARPGRGPATAARAVLFGVAERPMLLPGLAPWLAATPTPSVDAVLGYLKETVAAEGDEAYPAGLRLRWSAVMLQRLLREDAP